MPCRATDQRRRRGPIRGRESASVGLFLRAAPSGGDCRSINPSRVSAPPSGGPVESGAEQTKLDSALIFIRSRCFRRAPCQPWGKKTRSLTPSRAGFRVHPRRDDCRHAPRHQAARLPVEG